MNDEDWIAFKRSVLEGDVDVVRVLEELERERAVKVEAIERLNVAREDGVRIAAREKEVLRRLAGSFPRSTGREHLHTRSKYRWHSTSSEPVYSLRGGGITAEVFAGSRVARLADVFVAFVAMQGFRVHESEHGSVSDAIAAAEEALERGVALRRMSVDEPWQLPEIEVRF